MPLTLPAQAIISQEQGDRLVISAAKSDGGFDGQIADLFGVKAIPATFSIDADGVLEDQHVGDADIEGKLKKMIARANEVKNRKPLPLAGQSSLESN